MESPCECCIEPSVSICHAVSYLNLQGKRSLGRPRRRWEDNIRMNLKEIGVNMRNWVDSAQEKGYWRVLVNAALNLRVP